MCSFGQTDIDYIELAATYKCFYFFCFFLFSVTDFELRRIKDAFKRSAGTSGTALSKSAFVQDVLGDGVPTVVADWLYAACGGTPKGIAFKELLCGLILLTKGTQDEKIRLVFNFCEF